MTLINLGKILKNDPSKQDIKNEPMVYSSDYSFSYSNSGRLTRACLSKIKNNPLYSQYIPSLLIDTRVHMLKPGWFPSIPGWHCDGIPRREDKSVSLGHESISYIHHYIALFDFKTESFSRFLSENPTGLPNSPDDGETLWGTHSKLIKKKISNKTIDTFDLTPNTLYRFDAMDYHTSIPATGHGFRYFFRASYGVSKKPVNEVRNQVQTYLPYEDLGW